MDFSLNKLTPSFFQLKTPIISTSEAVKIDDIQKHIADYKNTDDDTVTLGNKNPFDFNTWLENVPDDELSSKDRETLTNLFSHISDKDKRELISSGIALDDNFLSLANKLNDEELIELTETISAMSVSASGVNGNLGLLSTSSSGGKEKTTQFIDLLANSSAQTRDKLLSQAHQYAQNVTKTEDPSMKAYILNSEYQAEPGTKTTLDDAFTLESFSYKPSKTASDLQNFVSSVLASDDADALVNKLSQFNSGQQSKILDVFAWNIDSNSTNPDAEDLDLGNRLLDSMLEKNDKVRDSMLNFIGQITDRSSLNHLGLQSYKSIMVDKNRAPIIDIKSATLDVSDNRTDMLAGTIELLEDYQFSDDQLITMGDELSQLDRADQVSYLEITSVGLKKLINSKGNASKPIDLSNHEEKFNAIESLRQDPQVLDSVFKAHFGEQVNQDDIGFIKDSDAEMEDTPNKNRYYAMKANGDDVTRDVHNLIGILASYELFQNSSGSGELISTEKLAEKFNSINAKERDELTNSFHTELEENTFFIRSSNEEKVTFFSGLLEHMDRY